ncbi:SDR family NAD(P)-dependent oxidoreductase [Photobacterium angustum]|uniref:SDR family NAD(P)-dependent oxidoreductase n=2 Tax=Photobacterium angustum TaxID=661 RepID=A0A855SD31_PHOAN|nr:SDR family NAD(P)-dependent oxidoreductase [Photobacterium angustum]PSX04980.1 SDR family NAD(P)-dependent oxidoreductase [Photobacterium angustum]PSX15492.1 SDR family NAD(P)-dependent oxidoreductase [Photobacterium angustum]PSX23984.1 SDR family NAD(P)-dependent oxidoreductase [Photobacterium angustum]PSX39646.1 SDR family NAD(P)-dependent oxidoreductase [Photobacterium angustum]
MASTSEINEKMIMQTQKKKVLVVGATGFLGRKILRSLMQHSNVDIKAMSRRGAPQGEFSELEWVQADMMDPASLDAALQGVDVVISSANGYMKESLDADFQGNKNLAEAAARANIERFVFLSIVNSDEAQSVPHFHAKKVAEDVIKQVGIPYVFVRAPAFLDQTSDYIADGFKAGRFYAIGDTTTKWSYILTDDLADYLAKAAAFEGDEINNKSIDVGWSDGAKSQAELVQLISEVTGKKLSTWTVPWFVFQLLVRPIKLFSELGYDMLEMFLFFKKGRFVADISDQERFFGPAPLAKDVITRWAKNNKFID